MIQCTITGAETIELNEKTCTGVEFKMLTPKDSNARSTDQYTDLILEGKIIQSVSSATTEASVGIDKWAQVTDDKADAYRNVVAVVTEAGIIVRKYTLPNAFVVNYDVDYSDDQGVGTFKLHVRQKKDKTKAVAIDGGFDS